MWTFLQHACNVEIFTGIRFGKIKFHAKQWNGRCVLGLGLMTPHGTEGEVLSPPDGTLKAAGAVTRQDRNRCSKSDAPVSRVPHRASK
jgi:hypothetical protein